VKKPAYFMHRKKSQSSFAIEKGGLLCGYKDIQGFHVLREIRQSKEAEILNIKRRSSLETKQGC